MKEQKKQEKKPKKKKKSKKNKTCVKEDSNTDMSDKKGFRCICKRDAEAQTIESDSCESSEIFACDYDCNDCCNYGLSAKESFECCPETRKSTCNMEPRRVHAIDTSPCCSHSERNICKTESKIRWDEEVREIVPDPCCSNDVKDNKVIRYRTKSELEIENEMKSMMHKYGADYLSKKILIIAKKQEAENELKARKKEAVRCSKHDSNTSFERKSILKKCPSYDYDDRRCYQHYDCRDR